MRTVNDIKPMPEEQTLEPPRCTDVHTEEECDRMLALPLSPETRDAWLDERLLCTHSLALYEYKRRLRANGA